MSNYYPTANPTNVRVKRAPHWIRTQPVKHMLFTPTDAEYAAMRRASMGIGGINVPYERDYETKVVTLQGRDVEKLSKQIRKFSPDAEITIQRPNYYMKG